MRLHISNQFSLGNKIGDEGGKLIGEALESNTTLTSLVISGMVGHTYDL